MVNGADTAWLMTSSVLVLMMTLPGLALFYAGLVQAKNILSVLIQCLAVACAISLLWFAFGYSEAFSGSAPFLGDMNAAFLQHAVRRAVHAGTSVPETVFVMFQMTFAIITPALIVGAYVERIRFAAVVMFSSLWLLAVYAPVVHWVWGGGWLAARGVTGFRRRHRRACHRRNAQLLVVAWMLGPRARISARHSSAACTMDGDGRRLPVVGGLVRLQCGQRDQGRRGCRHDDAGDASCGGLGHAHLDDHRTDQIRKAEPRRRGHRGHRGARYHHARVGLCRPARRGDAGVRGRRALLRRRA